MTQNIKNTYYLQPLYPGVLDLGLANRRRCGIIDMLADINYCSVPVRTPAKLQCEADVENMKE